MLAGEQNTGKTTIARYLVGKKPTKQRISTDGIDLYKGLSYLDLAIDEWLDGEQGNCIYIKKNYGHRKSKQLCPSSVTRRISRQSSPVYKSNQCKSHSDS